MADPKPPNRLVGAVLPETNVAGATAALDQVGLTAHDVVSASGAIPDEATTAATGRRLGKGLIQGAVIGALVLAGGMVLLAVLTESADPGVLLIAAVSGAIGGGFIGGYLGMTRHRRRLWRQRDFEQVDTPPGDVLLIVDPGDSRDLAEDILRQHGGEIVDPPNPDD